MNSDARKRLVEDLRNTAQDKAQDFDCDPSVLDEWIAADLIEQQQAEIARLSELEADAERYRAICMRLRGVGGYTIGIIAQHAFSDDAQLLVGPEADAAIDAALAATRTASAESAEENLKP